MALGIGYGLPFVAQHGTNPYKTQWAAALEGAKGAGATVEDENAGTGSCLVARGQDVYTDGLPSTPSLLIVPQFYKAGNLYQDVPPFVAEDSTMRFTVSRNTTATRVNSSGLIASVASGILRLDYPVTGGCPAALIEPSAQNLVLQSETFDVSGTWTLVTGGTGVNPVVTPNAAISPDGTQSADNIVLNVGSGTLSTDVSIIRQNITVSAVAYTYSIWLKSNTGTNQFVSLRFNSAPSQEVTITNDWQRFTFTGTPASGSRDFGLDLRGNNTSGQKTCNILAWGAQVETGSVATTYIPTTTAAVSRAADVISASGALVSGLIGQTEGTIYAEVDVRNFASSAARRIVNMRVDGNNLLSLEINSAGTSIEFVATSGGVAVTTTASGLTSGIQKIAVGYNSAASGTALYVNGTLRDTKTIAIPSLASVVFGLGVRADGGAGTQLNDRIRAAALYTTRLSNEQLANLTRLT
jgi:hypothetical protein